MALPYESGNLLIKHNDKWRGDYYLKHDLTFSPNRSEAAHFYLLKPGDTTILNGDRVSINSGNRTLILDEANNCRLIDRDQHHRGIRTFIISNNKDSTDPINYDQVLFFISDKTARTALKYEWSMDIIRPNDGSGSSTYKPRNFPNLTTSTYGTSHETELTPFQFQLERATEPITNLEDNRTVAVAKPTRNDNLFDRYKGAILLFFLMILLVLCIMVNGR